MSSVEKLLQTILGARSDSNVRFDELRRVLTSLGFAERIKGSHYIFTRENVEEILNLQPLPGGKAKPYQVKQVRQVITKHRLGTQE